MFFLVMEKIRKILDTAKIVTNRRLLRKYMRKVPGEKSLTFEKYELNSWLYKMFTCKSVENKNYKKVKTDELDAKQSADLLRENF